MRVVTSTSAIGSSAIRSSGSHASAMAIITRWRVPLESWCGYASTLVSGEAIPRDFSIAIASWRASLRDLFWWRAMSSTSWLPIVCTGFSDARGSWEIIAILLPRSEAIAASGSSSRFCPPNTISPFSILPGSGTSRAIASDVTVLPHPDSPTRASVLPFERSSEMPSTTRGALGNEITRWRTESKVDKKASRRCLPHAPSGHCRGAAFGRLGAARF